MKALLLIPTFDAPNFSTIAENFAKSIGAAYIAPFDGDGDSKLRAAISEGRLDELLEKVVATQSTKLTVVKGLATLPNTPYASLVNRNLANGLDADVVFVSQNTEELAVFAAAFGGLKSERVLGVIAVGSDEFDTTVWATADGEQLTVDEEVIKNYQAATRVKKLSPYAFRNQVVQKAQAAKKRIVLPEGDEPRTIEAAAICQSRGIAQCVLLGERAKIEAVAAERGVVLPSDIEIIDPASIADKYVTPMVERRKGKIDEAGAKQALQDTVVLGTMMLHMGDVDGLVSGAVHTTADTIRPAFQLIKTAPQYSLVSSVFFMLLPEQVMVYGDCAVNPNPTAEQLAEIAIQSAKSAKAFGIDPKVAMISYSTIDSGSGVDVDAVKQAVQIIREKSPELKVDGPLQFDAATVKNVGKQKAPNSAVAGEANVLIFPDLNTGNTTYKAVQRTADVISVGPMLQGLNKPVNDLSRGALVDDIVYTIALTAIQAIDE
ncbi:Phosphate acetyltransferase [Moraxella catarrhalis]|uniref:Phosphate acetyltransferase n=1 Tax=Moraxella catarrhalis TaxID=480 RepID=A0A198UFN3_MORCA|nr:Phosphate acetyltransferase [Moraxella catarrhalis]OAU99202.1 Phosphate acetyltransferase [Moraxella catarrhalis]OAV03903.1 Phosphate acetyltransferase [Moraxella catarrhalis]